MSRAVIILYADRDRKRAHRWIEQAQPRTIVEFREAVRSIDQNARMWSMLTDLSRQLEWHGQRHSAEDWKQIMMAGLKRHLRTVPNIDGDGFVILGYSTSKLTKSEFTELLDLISAFGAQHGVTFRAEANEAPPHV